MFQNVHFCIVHGIVLVMSQCGSRPVVTGPAGEHITASNPGVLSFNHWGLPPVDMFAVVLNSQPPVHVFNSRQQYTQWIATHNLSQGHVNSV